MTMEFKEFHNALRILLNIDADEFIKAVHPEHDGSPPPQDHPYWKDWYRFRDNPHMWMIRVPTAQAQAIWALVEARQSKG